MSRRLRPQGSRTASSRSRMTPSRFSSRIWTRISSPGFSTRQASSLCNLRRGRTSMRCLVVPPSGKSLRRCWVSYRTIHLTCDSSWMTGSPGRSLPSACASRASWTGCSSAALITSKGSRKGTAGIWARTRSTSSDPRAIFPLASIFIHSLLLPISIDGYIFLISAIYSLLEEQNALPGAKRLA